MGGWTDNEGEIQVPSKVGSTNKKKGKEPKKKEFDPRTDNILDINPSEDYLMDSLQNFKPPQESSMDKSISVFGDNRKDRTPRSSYLNDPHKVIAGVKLDKMIDPHDESFNEIK